MQRRRHVGLLLGAALWTSSAAAQEPPPPTVDLTYARAVALARARAPQRRVADARADEARQQIARASIWPFEPQLIGSLGPRFGAVGTRTEGSIAVQQWLELGGQRGDRVEAARSGATAAVARRDDVDRRLVRDVGIAFAAALYWDERIRLADERLAIAEAVADVAARRREVGDVGRLEVSVAALSASRARMAAAQARAARAEIGGRLVTMLGLPADAAIACQGDLRALGDGAPEVGDVDDRPDLRALRADIAQAAAEETLGRGRRVPNVAVGARYTREEGDDLVRGTLSVALPVFDRGQGEVAVAGARGARLQAELEAARAAAAVEARTTRARAERLRRAARRFEADGLATIERSASLAAKSYEAGAIPLAELLAVRRELVEAKVEYADLLLGAAYARAEHAASVGGGS